EARAERTRDALRQMTAPTALVVRDSEQQTVPVEDLVAGDVVWLHEGDIVPADAELLELTQVQVDESSLTGESMPVAKAPTDPVWAGTTVLAGRAVALVVATGARTRYGRIGTLVADVGAR